MGFEEVIGQKATCERLVKMVRESRLPHAILLCGPQGCGKMAVAMAFASYLLTLDEAHRVNAEAMLAKWQHPDLHFAFPVIRPSGTASDHKMVSDDNQQAQIGVGESDDLIRKLSLKSSQGGFKVCIIWLPERMNAECANKMLKIIEEPPQQTVFLMVCEEPGLLLETIRSRTQRIDLKRIDDSDIEQALIDRRGIGADDAHRIAHVSNGNWLKALDTLDSDNENSIFLDMFVQLMRLAYQRNIKELKKWSETVSAYGRERQKRMLTYFLHLIRENFMYNFHDSELVYMTQPEENFSRNFARFINEANVIELSELFSLAIRDIGQNANPKIVFFDMVLRVIVLLIQK